ncbi:MAG: hypothetical protein A2445_02610 [Candidatus Jacksonbacteria bacterium RIFOXYC2_FULL_44_29]|nr:MAG: Protein containing Heat shock protein Hsp20 protein [Parcubacteria group bacterium GW2011_GWA2_42_28]KKT55894.1 MAG: Protein containing Heat shock protein Hsp20 protein [Parcubacteria group bacterium GW2011_GWC2_44_22]OGY74508.1 MAG: hypothetical protein A2240_02865 [Candidatus Jacksonbacteria bacterium RIFOXYA2_FULL_43_12]OGY77417.1 MAG: hypothetical protein A2295_01815 [Candidatus Jacksonbacteria bacterium RIFOXYB2_FULL_44_15]OGY78189.1 MAG: hypothetical protein A2550_06160 [Candidatu
MISRSFFAKITGIKKSSEPETETIGVQTEESPNQSEQEMSKKIRAGGAAGEDMTEWAGQNYDGQLSVDVYQTDDEIVIKSAVAGVDSENLDISISNDMITIRGTRKQEEEIQRQNYFYQECYWGSFSRSIILPQEIQADAAVAEFKKGILTIRLPKAKQVQKIHIKVTDQSS